MRNAPTIIVQLIHIEGPLKGEIQEYSESEIYIGRHSSCQVRFPKDFSIVSRKHARLIREGNRYKIVDESSNGTFLNGKKVTEAFLKDGDVLMFAEGGPKVSFLTNVDESKVADALPRVSAPLPQQPGGPDPSHLSLPQSPPVPPHIANGIESHTAPPENGNSQPNMEPALQSVKVPLIIQHGPTLQSYNDLPIVIGKSPNCDFILNQPSIVDQHAQIFFSRDQYWIKDLTGRQSIRINGDPVNVQCALTPEDILMLSDQGPSFRFLGGGRLAEIEQPAQSTPADSKPENNTTPGKKEKSRTEAKKSGSFLKKLFS